MFAPINDAFSAPLLAVRHCYALFSVGLWLVAVLSLAVLAICLCLLTMQAAKLHTVWYT